MDSLPTPDPNLNNPPLPPPESAPAPPDDAQLPFRVWLVRNGTFLAIVGLVLLAGYSFFGLQGLLAVGLAAVGLGFVIFIHELGHFAVAKWCDVHVQTFSIGFGPALPGCSFKRGETTYKIAAIPLGGYVKMVGEGDTSEEDEDDPRSFKNKSVGQRMMIISAGVIMNVILGCICFIIAYHSGVKMTADAIGDVEPGSPAWKAGIRSGMAVGQVDNIREPFYEDMLYEVLLSTKGQQLHFVVSLEGSPAQTINVEPRREEYDSRPVIGVLSARSMQLIGQRMAKRADALLTFGAARFARQLDLEPGDVILATTNPGSADGPLLEMKEREQPGNYAEFSRRLESLAGREIQITVQRQRVAEPVRLTVPAAAFEFGDRIVGTSDPDGQLYDPYRLKPLPPQRGADNTNDDPDYFAFIRRMQDLAGKPVVLQALRHDKNGSEHRVSVFVPPAFYQMLGLRMHMGKVAALRDGSPAAKGGMLPSDRIKQLEMRAGQETIRFSNDPPQPGVAQRELDPLRLPYEMQQWANRRPGVAVTLTVLREKHHEQEQPEQVGPLAWDNNWKYSQEQAFNTRSPVSIPCLGIAYFVETTVDAVAPGSPAQKEGLQPGDVISEYRVKIASAKEPEGKWSPWIELFVEQKPGPTKKLLPGWPSVMRALQVAENGQIEVKVMRGDQELPQSITLNAVADETWPLEERGLQLENGARMQRADSLWSALGMGVERTRRSITQVYLSLRSMATNRVSATKNLVGPLTIATTAYNIAGEDLPTFVLFLAVISINLAVVNFLPVPVLDGGHMVFLIYEKLRGRPPSENVRLAATYVGLFLILSLMAFVIYLDVKRQIIGS